MISKKMLLCSMALALGGLGVGCGDDDGGGTDAGDVDAGGGTDSGTDAGGGVDSGPPVDAGGVDSGPPAMPTCGSYCEAILANCTEGNAQYAPNDMATCVGFCSTNAGWPEGTSGMTSGTTIGCREYHAGAAAMDPGLHCPHAGQSGADTCGTWCENYCQLAIDNCEGPRTLYPDVATCMAACPAIPDDGMPGATSGNTIQCRIYHLGVAGTDMMSANTHCPHGSATPTGPCGG